MGWTQMQAGEVAGIDYRTIQRWELGKTMPDRHRVMGLAYMYGRPLGWFYGDDSAHHPPLYREPLTDRLSMLTRILRTAAASNGLTLEGLFGLEGRSVHDEPEAFAHPDGLQVEGLALFDSSPMSADAGAHNDVLHESRVDHSPLDPGWLRSQALNPEFCEVISVLGNSMEPTLPDGSSILVNRDSKELRDGTIFVLQTSDGLVVNRVREINDSWILGSDNAAWPPVPLDVSDVVIGEVIWNARMIQPHGYEHHPRALQDQVGHVDGEDQLDAVPAPGRTRHRAPAVNDSLNYTQR
jgi:phage repressor protein C with HTH and peptisase S24 domain